MGCFAIASTALLEDTRPNAFVEEFRPALWTEARETLPSTVFSYSAEALKKALVSLRSAYGPVSPSPLDGRARNRLGEGVTRVLPGGQRSWNQIPSFGMGGGGA